MSQVEGKTFHKFIEKKYYRTDLYYNYCNISDKSDAYYITKKNGKYYNDTQLFTEEDFVKNYGNTLATVSFVRERFFIEESEDKISVKYQRHTKERRVGNKFFRERKITKYITFNFKNRMFYSGTFTTKKKQVIGRSMKINPTFYVIDEFINSVNIDVNVKPENHLHFFLQKIWDRMNLVAPEYLTWKDPKSFYYITYYLVNGIKVPDNWKKFAGVFFGRKELRNANMNLVECAMNKLKLKGSKVKQIFNEIEWIDFDRLYVTYHILGIDRFNKIDNDYFSEHYMYNDYGYVLMEKAYMDDRLGGFYECFHSHSESYFNGHIETPLTSKEKDRILNMINYFDQNKFRTLLDHLHFKKELLSVGEDVKFKFNDINSFNLEHEELSSILQSYRRGEVERFYGDVDSLETPIEYEGETYYPVLLRKTADYEKESQHQRNCVRGYSERPDCLIFSIRKGSTDGDERITVEYQYRKNEILNVQERSKFNETPSLEFSHVAKIQLANINLLYKLGTLKLPKMVKKYRNGKVIEQQSVFDQTSVYENGNGARIIALTPLWDTSSPLLQTWQNQILDDMPDEPVRNFVNWIDELP